jgi:hypothetical protein
MFVFWNKPSVISQDAYQLHSLLLQHHHKLIDRLHRSHLTMLQPKFSKQTCVIDVAIMTYNEESLQSKVVDKQFILARMGRSLAGKLSEI